MAVLVAGIERIKNLPAIARQERQDDAEAEQINEHHQEDNQQSGAVGSRIEG